MRVLMVNKYARITGGADKQCMALAASLRGLGHEVAFLATASSANAEIEGAFVPTLVTHETRGTLSMPEQLRVFRDAVWNRDAATAMERLIADFRPDIVHAHKLYPQLSVAPIRKARAAGLPIVQTLHDYEFIAANPFDATGGLRDHESPRRSYRALNTATYGVRRALHVPAVTQWIAVSSFVAQTYARRGIETTVIPNFADSEPAASPRPLESRTGILFLGALSTVKGLHDVLAVARKHPSLSVVIAGRGPLRELVVAEAAKLDNVEFKGHLDAEAVAGEIAAARIVVVPSHWEEPGSLVALEAMAAGTPLVAYARGGLSEYVGGSGAGLAIEADWRALASACLELIADTDLWWRCANAGLQASRERFSRASHIEAVLRVYERALASRRRLAERGSDHA